MADESVGDRISHRISKASRELSSGVVHDLDFQQIQGGQQIGTSDSDALEERNLCLPGSLADWNCGFNLNEFNLLASLNLLEAYPFVCPVPTENLRNRPTFAP